jgi:hypothetical protein
MLARERILHPFPPILLLSKRQKKSTKIEELKTTPIILKKEYHLILSEFIHTYFNLALCNLNFLIW